MQETQKQNEHVMICHDTCYDVCHEGINTHVICHDSNEMYEKNVQLKGQLSGNTGKLENQLTTNCSQPVTDCHELDGRRLSKDEWWFLVDTLESWRVFNPRAIVKKNPAAAWRCMNICKDRNVRVKGAYFTACFRTELAKQKAHQNFVDLLEKKCGVA